MKSLEKLLFVFVAYTSWHSNVSAGSILDQTEVTTCEKATLARPGLGVSYQGFVSNEDYKFAAKIPKGEVAWSGVAENAPFHGFTIFLDSKMSSCINFEIHIRVSGDDASTFPQSTKKIRLGDGLARQWVNSGRGGGSFVTNINTSFSIERSGTIVDGTILLISPTSDLDRTKGIYDKFVRTARLTQ